ncbi:MAG: hypothetical protein Q4A16_01500 [Lautropia sp.]|nr:hypothetical protein [Lautropia sp.]
MNRLQKRTLAARRRQASLAALSAVALSAISLPTAAVEHALQFGEPIVLSQQGQRLKVLLPFETAPHDRATAVAFMVEKAEVPDGFRAPTPSAFTIMRPDETPYVILHSAEQLDAPNAMLTVSVAGDPSSPYQLRVDIPANDTIGTGSAGQDARSIQGLRRAVVSQKNGFRRVPTPTIRNDLPPK